MPSAQERPAFQTDAYRTSLEVGVVDSGSTLEGPYVVLQDTLLYPEGGGQPRDFGTVAGLDVTDLVRQDGQILHYLSGPPDGILPSGTVTVELDWARRFDHMQQHTAQHLLTAVTQARFGPATTSFHLGEDVCAIEVDGPVDDLAALEEVANEVVRQHREVRVEWVTTDAYEARTDIRTRGLPDHHAGDVRLVQIEGVDLTACGGTHVANTAEVEALKILGSESKRGGTRLHWIAGKRLRSRLGGHETRSAALRGALGVANEELVTATEQRVDQLKDAQKQLKILEGELAEAVIPSLLAGADPIVSAHFEGKDGGFVRTVATGFAKQARTQVGFFTAATDGDAFFALSVGPEAKTAVDQLGSMVAGTLGGRGGGKGQLFQGKAGSLDRRAEALSQLKDSLSR